jgi:endoglucanase
VTRFPQQPITFFNCGISGDNTTGILNRMDTDILINRPTHVVLMIGMNDVKRNLYGAMPTQDVDTLKQRAAALTVYKTNLDSIIRIFLSKNIKVILQKPTIYDQTAILKTTNNLGVNDALKNCADYIEELAEKYQLPFVDYWTILNTNNHDLQK